VLMNPPVPNPPDCLAGGGADCVFWGGGALLPYQRVQGGSKGGETKGEIE